MIEKPITKCDSGTQTDTHFMETNIVKSYEWNEWELRRKAIKLVRVHLSIKGMNGNSSFKFILHSIGKKNIVSFHINLFFFLRFKSEI